MRPDGHVGTPKMGLGTLGTRRLIQEPTFYAKCFVHGPLRSCPNWQNFTNLGKRWQSCQIRTVMTTLDDTKISILGLTLVLQYRSAPKSSSSQLTTTIAAVNSIV